VQIAAIRLATINDSTKEQLHDWCVFLLSKHAALAERLKACEEELERERIRLAACGVAALGYFDGCKDEYRSASLEDTLRLYAKYDQLTADLAQARADVAGLEVLSHEWKVNAELADKQNQRLRAAVDSIQAEPVTDWDSSATLRIIIAHLQGIAKAALTVSDHLPADGSMETTAQRGGFAAEQQQ
jgi:hypothetical protein